jgi:hypothetical protein
MRRMAAIVALLFAPAAGAAFKCVDEQGRTFIGETPPEGCAHVMMYEISRSGNIIRRIEPTPTPEQAKAREEENRRRRELERREAEQQRHDKALLATFASEKEFDVARDRNIEPLTGRIRSAQDRITDIDQRLEKIDEEVQLYRSGKRKLVGDGEVPQHLVAERDRHVKEKQALVSSIAASEKDIVAQRERFDRDKKRWVELRSHIVSQPATERK